MDYSRVVELVYEHIDRDEVAKAVMCCLRLARHLKDHLNSAIFLREMYPDKRELARALRDDIGLLNKEAQKFIMDKSLDYWLEAHTIDFALADDGSDEKRNVLKIGIGDIAADLEQCQRSIEDLKVPAGMGEYDTAAFTDRYSNLKAQMRLRIRALQTIRERVKARCLNYAIEIERQLSGQRKGQNFLEMAQNDVNNYFKGRSEDVYDKLQKATQLISSNDPEDLSLLLTQVRRCIKAVADFFYPPPNGVVRCSDGNERVLGEEHYLNRLHEFVTTKLQKSTSRDLISAELEHLAVLARRLNDIASKGVHANVSLAEAKQGLVALYLFLTVFAYT